MDTVRGLADRLRTRIRVEARRRRGGWWSLLILGAGSVAVGLAMLIWPRVALRTFAMIIGGWMVVNGITRLVVAFMDRTRPRDRQRMAVAVGLACVAAGLVCLSDSNATLRLLAVVLAVQWLVAGIGDVLDGLQDRRPGRVWLIALGTLSTLTGVLFLAWPAASLLAFVVLAGVSAIGIGVLDIVAGLRLRRLRE